MTDARLKFQQKLRDLFQFESADLDFGIYRIMNYRRAAIERFIEKDLLDAVSKELASGTLADQAKAAEELENLRKRIVEDISDDAVDADGALQEKHRDTRLGRQYLELQTRLGGGKGKAEHEALVFNHLYTFFSRYYDAGDFLSLRRYSKKERYAIPYNGEEVHLHWANSDQYFIKTGENFTDYSFRSGDVTVRFKLRTAETEQDNRKAEKRFFLPQIKDITVDPAGGTTSVSSATKRGTGVSPVNHGQDARATRVVTIPFEYRQLTEQETITYGKKNQQDAIIAAALAAIPKRLKDDSAALTALMTERRKTADGEPVSYLAHHLRSYARRNTMDYFIHKDLGAFLGRELDFYLKNEVLNLDEVTVGGETLGEAWFQIMRTIRAIGGKIIAFLAQIEDFQKRLFEKRKFVTATHYAITLGQISEKFHEDIAGNEDQWREWKELLHIDEEAGDKDLFTPKTKKARRLRFLKDHPTLVLDTRHFDPSFKDDLLATFDNLDDTTDGLLFHGENFQALNLMQEKFREKVKCIYIDPPYNTGGDGFPYKDGYQHSSWMSMLVQTSRSARGLLDNAGVFFASIDDGEVANFRGLLGGVYGYENFICSVVWQKKYAPQNDAQWFSDDHDFILVFSKNRSLWHPTRLDRSDQQNAAYKNADQDPRGPWKAGDYTSNKTSIERPNLYYAIANPNSGENVWPSKGRVWAYSKEQHQQNVDENRIWWGVDGKAKVPAYKRFLSEVEGVVPRTIWLYEDVGHNQDAVRQLQSLFGVNPFASPKPIGIVKRIAEVSQPSIIADYFAGSGSTGRAMIEARREGKCDGRFLLVEMGEYFDTVLLPSLKKVTFTPEWKDGKPSRMATKQEAERSPRIIKYHRIESYEDALNNIRLDDAAGQTALRFDDYLLNYMLNWESKDCETFLNVGKLASPFSYKLVLAEGLETREQPVDLPETFAYLMGLQIGTRRVHLDKGRRYLVHRGTCGTRKTAVIWRDTAGWTEADRKRDAEFVAKEKLTEGAADVFVNGDSHIPEAKSLDPVFKQRMFAGVG